MNNLTKCSDGESRMCLDPSTFVIWDGLHLTKADITGWVQHYLVVAHSLLRRLLYLLSNPSNELVNILVPLSLRHEPDYLIYNTQTKLVPTHLMYNK